MSHNKSTENLKYKKKTYFLTLMTIRKWHWMSSAICFACMLLFAITGVTLNHAEDIEATPAVTKLTGQVPDEYLKDIVISNNKTTTLLPEPLKIWFKNEKKISLNDLAAEVNDGEIYIALTRPGGDAWLSISETGAFEFETTDRGWVAYFNDLHKGRHTGKAWICFMDLFAIACVIFSITGFLLLQRYADTRAQTWPLMSAGVLLPVLLMVFLVH